MVVSVVVGLQNMFISRLDGFRIMRRSRKHTSITSMCGVELYVCVYLVYIFVVEVGFVRLVSYMIKMSTHLE